jgi:uncharacterized SAM-binding protein YcdF (DUF218 family)
MASLLSFLFSVGGVVVVLLFVALWLRVRPASRWARGSAIGAALFYTLASVYAIPHTASRMLARGYSAFSASDLPTGRIAIVVLGAGGVFVRDWDGRFFPVMDRANVTRIVEAARLHRLMPEAWVITSGGGTGRPGQQPAAVLMRDALVRLGVPESRILLESESLTTHEEAVLIGPTLRSLAIDRVILVTSDTHMWRSIGTFRAAGIVAIPAIARESYPTPDWSGWVLPSNSGLNLSSLVVHELVGIAGYRLRGWF